MAFLRLVLSVASDEVSFCVQELQQVVSRILDITPESPQDEHATVEGAHAFVSQDRAHVEQLLLVVNINALLDLLFDTPRTAHSAILHLAVLRGERADLLLTLLQVDDLREE